MFMFTEPSAELGGVPAIAVAAANTLLLPVDQARPGLPGSLPCLDVEAIACMDMQLPECDGESVAVPARLHAGLSGIGPGQLGILTEVGPVANGTLPDLISFGPAQATTPPISPQGQIDRFIASFCSPAPSPLLPPPPPPPPMLTPPAPSPRLCSHLRPAA